jgi:formyl-CoA transferase/succinyl-CoA--D-citramalate CoA-transferase
MPWIVYNLAMNDTRGPLVGTRVLELGSFIAGPFAGQLLGDYGAEVVKIESPTSGDPMRRWGINLDGESLWWPIIARNKRSVALDLRDEGARALLRRLVTEVDVVVENFRPGTLEDWGLDYEALSAINPRLVMTHVSGFGQTGPRAREAGFGSVGEAMGGIRHTTGSPDLPPARSGVSLGDSLSGMFAVIGTLAALVERDKSGLGQEVDVAIYEAVAALMESTLADHEVGGVTRGRTGSVLPGVAPSNVYPTSDGAEVLIAANADTVFGRLAAAMGAPGLASDPRYAGHADRGAHQAELDEVIATWTATLPSDELLALLESSGVPAGRIYTAADMLSDPHYAARDMVVRVVNAAGRSLPAVGVVPKFSRTHPRAPVAGPRLGEHTDEILRTLAGAASAQLDALDQRGAVRRPATAPAH